MIQEKQDIVYSFFLTLCKKEALKSSDRWDRIHDSKILLRDPIMSPRKISDRYSNTLQKCCDGASK
jgi:hypothetical protein